MGCSQKDGDHYNSSSIYAPIINDAMIQIMLMLMTNWETRAIDVKIACQHGRLKDGEKIYERYIKGSKNFMFKMKCCY